MPRVFVVVILHEESLSGSQDQDEGEDGGRGEAVTGVAFIGVAVALYPFVLCLALLFFPLLLAATSGELHCILGELCFEAAVGTVLVFFAVCEGHFLAAFVAHHRRAHMDCGHQSHKQQSELHPFSQPVQPFVSRGSTVHLVL